MSVGWEFKGREEQTHEQATGINESEARGSTWRPGEQWSQPRDSGGAS